LSAPQAWQKAPIKLYVTLSDLNPTLSNLDDSLSDLFTTLSVTKGNEISSLSVRPTFGQKVTYTHVHALAGARTHMYEPGRKGRTVGQGAFFKPMSVDFVTFFLTDLVRQGRTPDGQGVRRSDRR
jgi:hypothetical protein